VPDPPRTPSTRKTRTRIWLALLAVLGADYLLVAAGTSGATRVLSALAALLIAAGVALAIAAFPLLAVGVVALGTLPLAVHTWWSIVTPALALLSIIIALAQASHVHHAQTDP
jgi:hypothetical protein